MTAAFCSGLVLFLAGVAAHLVVLRFTSSRWFLALGLLLGAAVGAVGAIRIAPSGAGYALVALFVFGTLWFVYLVVLVNVQNSVTLRIVREIARSPVASASQGELDAAFPDEAALESRIAAMERNRLVAREGDDIAVRPLGAFIGRCVLVIRKAFGIVRSG